MRVIVQMPTGAGKTRLAAEFLRNELECGRRAMFVVPAIVLINQAMAAFNAEGLRDIGVIQANHPETDERRPLQVASVQTLLRRKIPPADLVIIDEAHRWFEFYETWFADPDWQETVFIGLTATPWTRGLGNYYKDFIVGSTIQELIGTGHLCDFRVFAPGHPDLTGVKTVAGDFKPDQLARAMNKQALVADIVETWLERGEDRQTLCFCVDRAHAKAVQLRFEEAGVRSGYVDYFSTPEERETVRVGFQRGELKVICNVGVLTTGVDWDVRCIILARPTRSRILFTQIIGRGLRSADGKEALTILDHSDNHLRLGFVTEEPPQVLDDGEGPRRDAYDASVPLPTECPSCHFLRPPKVHVCPACGFAPVAVSKIYCDDGELVEIRRLDIDDRAEQARWHGMLANIGIRRGYQPGWAAHKFKEKFGHFPTSSAGAFLAEPSADVERWVRSRNIAFAKGARRRANG